jgi:hypothetical protein
VFIGHPEAGERSAAIFTLLGSRRRHGINSFDYLKELLFAPAHSAGVTCLIWVILAAGKRLNLRVGFIT